MYKKLLTIVCLLLFINTANAQNKYPFRVGLDVSQNVCFISPGVEGYRYNAIKLSNNYSIYGEVTITHNVSFRAGLSYNTYGGSIEYVQTKLVYDGHFDPKLNPVISSNDIRYVEVPLMIKATTNEFGKWSFSGALGVAPGFRVKATAYNEYLGTYTNNSYPNGHSATLVFKEDIKKDINIFNLAGVIRISTEYKLADRTALSMGIVGNVGLLNVFKKASATDISDFRGSLQQIGIFAGLVF